MKKISKRIISAILTVSMLFTLSATAMAEENEEAIEVSGENFDKENCQLIEATSYILKEDGAVIEVNPFLRDNSYEFDENNVNVTFFFYESSGTYYVSMDASTKDPSWWFTKHTMQIRPKNNSSWYKHSTPHEAKPNSISDEMYFSYPNGAPSNVTVEVKGYVAVSGEGFLDKQFSWPNATLDNP